MTFKQAKLFSASFVAILAMFVSSVSACACGHHEQSVEDASSCHVRSHSGHGETTQTTDAKTRIDEGCTCFVTVLSPCVLAKSGKKKAADNGPIAALPVRATVLSPVFGTVGVQPQAAIADPNHYLSTLAISMPSRAPPRL